MSFTESNTVEQMILNAIALSGGTAPRPVKDAPPGRGESLGDQLHPLNWDYQPANQISAILVLENRITSVQRRESACCYWR